jgi:phosphoglucosamine mutase
MGKLFGTDGIRGVVNEGLDAKLAFQVGQAAALVLSRKNRPDVLCSPSARIPGYPPICWRER